ncbi:hypothetical protein PVA44_06960 (plasmid) [Entomospira nematocerorum]|uniref:Uncharacterized protein n=1 Tax=Entomospira nematocerorum TaxID=2719987 RepID=A0A968GIB4_9SPIO|nr:hypothetical protein [Entomospira nematocera]NIZ47646.1 hypothetical protein [Entomospira nematocera]WDI34539.1 hypothetical protein PVA44_06960 [Entomospira nematocera]
MHLFRQSALLWLSWAIIGYHIVTTTSCHKKSICPLLDIEQIHMLYNPLHIIDEFGYPYTSFYDDNHTYLIYKKAFWHEFSGSAVIAMDNELEQIFYILFYIQPDKELDMLHYLRKNFEIIPNSLAYTLATESHLQWLQLYRSQLVAFNNHLYGQYYFIHECRPPHYTKSIPEIFPHGQLYTLLAMTPPP